MGEYVPHQPVMLKEVIEMLNPKIGGIYVDATIGTGGHSEALIELIGEKGKLIGIDRDNESLSIAEKRLSGKGIVLKMGNFSEIAEMIYQEGISEIDGALFDLGVSMIQLKDFKRGFSFFSQERLDMRMNKSQRLSAWHIVNTYSLKEIERILNEYGEERLSKTIARLIVNTRSKKTIDTCNELSRLIEKVYMRRGRIHPATKTFQALRIAVNKELDELKEGLNETIRLLKRGGRLCVISYHSLEDRIVKRFMLDKAKSGLLNIITKKPKTPSLIELKTNPSSRSAKLRAAEKI